EKDRKIHPKTKKISKGANQNFQKSPGQSSVFLSFYLISAFLVQGCLHSTRQGEKRQTSNLQGKKAKRKERCDEKSKRQASLELEQEGPRAVPTRTYWQEGTPSRGSIIVAQQVLPCWG
uniref:Uncharacterized protein n=1 Tax=Mustela putorius furo TaxID=9669 RepID=M3XNM6_MUSPF